MQATPIASPNRGEAAETTTIVPPSGVEATEIVTNTTDIPNTIHDESLISSVDSNNLAAGNVAGDAGLENGGLGGDSGDVNNENQQQEPHLHDAAEVVDCDDNHNDNDAENNCDKNDRDKTDDGDSNFVWRRGSGDGINRPILQFTSDDSNNVDSNHNDKASDNKLDNKISLASANSTWDNIAKEYPRSHPATRPSRSMSRKSPGSFSRGNSRSRSRCSSRGTSAHRKGTRQHQPISAPVMCADVSVGSAATDDRSLFEIIQDRQKFAKEKSVSKLLAHRQSMNDAPVSRGLDRTMSPNMNVIMAHRSSRDVMRPDKSNSDLNPDSIPLAPPSAMRKLAGSYGKGGNWIPANVVGDPGNAVMASNASEDGNVFSSHIQSARDLLLNPSSPLNVAAAATTDAYAATRSKMMDLALPPASAIAKLTGSELESRNYAPNVNDSSTLQAQSVQTSNMYASDYTPEIPLAPKEALAKLEGSDKKGGNDADTTDYPTPIKANATNITTENLDAHTLSLLILPAL